MKIIINIILLLIIVYNIIKRKNNIFHAKIPTTAIISSFVLLLICLYIWYSYDKTGLGLTIAIGATIAFISQFLAQGISKDYIQGFEQKLPIVRNIPFDSINYIRLIEDNSKITLTINAFSNAFVQYYDIKNKDDIIKHLDMDIDYKND